MDEVRLTLLGEGSSDRALLHPIRWLLHIHAPYAALQEAWADLGRLPLPPKGLAERIRSSVELYPCDVLFVHRDADSESREKRVDEITRAAKQVGGVSMPPFVCVVPVRMLEAWLLFDEKALRFAAGNPAGRTDLNLPTVKSLDSMADPKAKLASTLREASELSARRRARLPISPERVAALTQDFSPLRALSAFREFEADVERIVRERSENGQ
jgi:Domain of unknown function (DUF4276)